MRVLVGEHERPAVLRRLLDDAVDLLPVLRIQREVVQPWTQPIVSGCRHRRTLLDDQVGAVCGCLPRVTTGPGPKVDPPELAHDPTPAPHRRTDVRNPQLDVMHGNRHAGDYPTLLLIAPAAAAIDPHGYRLGSDVRRRRPRVGPEGDHRPGRRRLRRVSAGGHRATNRSGDPGLARALDRRPRASSRWTRRSSSPTRPATARARASSTGTSASSTHRATRRTCRSHTSPAAPALCG